MAAKAKKGFETKVRNIEGYDVLVAGGGPAGFAAAVAASRAGAKTLLVEATGCLGGMASSGLVPGWCGFHDGEKYIHRGLAIELLNGLRKYEGKAPNDDIKDLGGIDPEGVKLVLDELVLGSGVDVMFFSTVAEVEMDSEGKVAAAIIANKDGLAAVRAKAFVDCTGDADLCAKAGASFEKGDKDGDMQPVTLCFVMGGLPPDAMKGAPQGWKEKMIADPEFPLVKDDFFHPGFRINGGHLWSVDASQCSHVDKAMVDGRKMVRQFRDAFAKYLPGFKNSFVLQTASLLGVRETRRILGDYTLSGADHQARRRFEDEISFNSFFIDIHPSWANREREAKGEWSWEKEKRDSSFKKGEFHGIPYRCLTPKGLSNVITAGRAVSSDREAHSAIRVMPPCITMGEAAGVAASMAVKAKKADFHQVDVKELRAKLRKNGAFLPELP